MSPASVLRIDSPPAPVRRQSVTNRVPPVRSSSARTGTAHRLWTRSTSADSGDLDTKVILVYKQDSNNGRSRPMSRIAWANHMTAALSVSDLEHSIGWYRDVLGFELIYKLDDWGWAELRSPITGVNVGIGQTEEREPRGGATLTFGVADIDSARATLEAHDVRFDG